MRCGSLPYAIALALAPTMACTTEVPNPFDPGTSGATENPSTTVTPSTSGTTMSTGSDSSSSSSSSSTGDEEMTSGSGSTTTGSSSGSVCGNGIIEGLEQCDCGDSPCTPAGLDDTLCEDIKDPLAPGVLTGGVLQCNIAACTFNTDQCTYCGDGELNGIEGCELDLPIETDCMTLGEGSSGDLSCMKDCQLDTSACTDCGHEFEFIPAECPGEWTTGRTSGGAAIETWECGDPNNYALGPGVAKTGMWATNLTGPYSVSESGWLQSGNLDLSACGGQTVTLTIHHWYNFQGGVINGDGGIVQISSDASAWSQIHPSGGSDYPLGDPISADFNPVNGSDGFSGHNPDEGTWVDTEFDLTEYAGDEMFYLRFVMGSDNSSQQGGWYIDNVEVLGGG